MLCLWPSANVSDLLRCACLCMCLKFAPINLQPSFCIPMHSFFKALSNLTTVSLALQWELVHMLASLLAGVLRMRSRILDEEDPEGFGGSPERPSSPVSSPSSPRGPQRWQLDLCSLPATFICVPVICCGCLLWLFSFDLCWVWRVMVYANPDGCIRMDDNILFGKLCISLCLPMLPH